MAWVATAILGSTVVNQLMAPNAPAAPDYTGAAQAQAAGSVAAINAQTLANRSNVTTPWGSLTWTQNKDASGNPDGTWSQNVSLTPEQQAALDAQQTIQSNQSSLAQTLQGQVQDTMQNGLQLPSLSDYTSGIPGVNTNAPQFSNADAQAGAQAAYDSATSLMQPQMQQDTTNLDSQLRLQGLTPGSEAYNNAMQNLQRTQGQVLSQAASNSTLTGNTMANQNYQSALAGYSAGNTAQSQAYGQGTNNYNLNYTSALNQYLQPLNSMNAVLSGQQVQTPQFNNIPNSTAGAATPANLLGATQLSGQYNSGTYAANQSSNNALMGTLGSLGAASIMSPYALSDKRLKKNIVKFGKTKDGHNAYVWDWKDGSGHAYGVIAQEVAQKIPHAVIKARSGYLKVNYAEIR